MKTKAYLRDLEIYSPNKRDFKDNRKKVTYAVFSYFTDNGIEFRRPVTSKPNTSEVDMWNLAPKEIEVEV